MKLNFGINVNTLPDFLEGKTVVLLGYHEDDKTIGIEVSSEEVAVTRKKTRDSYFETLVTLKKPGEKKWEKYNFPTLKRPAGGPRPPY